LEGIRDGRALDNCFVCGLLFPDIGECPRCGCRMHYVPAESVDIESVVSECLARYSTDPKAMLEELLTTLHSYAPHSLDLLEAAGGPTLDELRRLWRASAP